MVVCKWEPEVGHLGLELGSIAPEIAGDREG